MNRDVQWVERAVAGDSEAFAALVARYRDAVYGLCYQRAQHAEEARDLAQESFVRAWLDLGRLRDPAAFPAWLRRVAERVCATWRRRQRLAFTPLDSVPETGQESDLALPVALRQALDGLAEGARLAVTLYYINGYSTGEVAQFLGIPAGTVKSRLHHARQRLKEELMDEYRDILRQSAPGPELDRAVVRTMRSLEEQQSLPRGRFAEAKTDDDLHRYLVLERDGSILGWSAYDPEHVVLRGVPVTWARQRFTTGENEWQEQGFSILDRLLEAELAHLAEEGYALAAWHGELACATRGGFVPCCWHYRVTVPAANLVSLEQRSPSPRPSPSGRGGTTVRPGTEADREACSALRRLPRSRPLMWAWQGPPGPADVPAFVLEQAGRILGCYSLAEPERPPLLVNEMEGEDVAAYQALAAHWAQTAQQQGVETLTTYLSPAHPLSLLMLSRGGTAEQHAPGWDMAKDEETVCIVDLTAALRAVAAGLGELPKGAVTIGMAGQVATINAGSPVQVTEGAPAGAAISRIGHAPMTQLLVGYRSAWEIAGREDVQIAPEHAPLLDRLFPVTSPYSWPDPYEWEPAELAHDRPWAVEEPVRGQLAAMPRPWL